MRGRQWLIVLGLEIHVLQLGGTTFVALYPACKVVFIAAIPETKKFKMLAPHTKSELNKAFAYILKSLIYVHVTLHANCM